MENTGSTALERIERALARIDRALDQPCPAPTANLAHSELAARHRTLREETRKALDELDALIEATG